MHRIWVRCLLLVALAAAAFATQPGPSLAAAKGGAPGAAGSGAASSKSKNALHQFTGVVTALDKTSLTVEKSGKQPTTRTFARHDEMNVVGDLAKDVRVTVYYRDENGKAVARKVVVKPATTADASR